MLVFNSFFFYTIDVYSLRIVLNARCPPFLVPSFQTCTQFWCSGSVKKKKKIAIFIARKMDPIRLLLFLSECVVKKRKNHCLKVFGMFSTKEKKYIMIRKVWSLVKNMCALMCILYKFKFGFKAEFGRTLSVKVVELFWKPDEYF